MGYYVQIQESDFIIPADSLDAAYRAMCELNRHDALKSGGSSQKSLPPVDSTSVSQSPHKWFSWMPWNYDETCTSLGEILSELGFEWHMDDEGDLYLTGYDSKAGNEDVFLEALAPYAVARGPRDPHIVWQGEDGDMWVNYVKDGSLHTKHITIDW